MDEERQEEFNDTALDLIKDKCSDLVGVFDTVQIFCTRYNRKEDGGDTTQFNWGAGNYYARYGQVKMWTKTEEKEETNRGLDLD